MTDDNNANHFGTERRPYADNNNLTSSKTQIVCNKGAADITALIA